MIYQLTPKITVLGKTIIKPDKSFSFLSYLLQGDKNILIDTVPQRAAEVFMQELESCIDLGNLDLLILNHSEEDHSGALAPLLQRRPDLPIYCSPACKARLIPTFPEANLIVVENRSVLDFGDFRFQFIHTPGLHWDDNMVSYLEKEQILFSNDLFGQSLGSDTPLDSEFTLQGLLSGTLTYFEKVFLPAPSEEKAAVLPITELPIAFIAPGHGVILQTWKNDVMEYYREVCN